MPQPAQPLSPSPRPLAGKTAVITGASAGIGWATAVELAAAGAAVVINARREDRLNELARQLSESGAAVKIVPGDAAASDVIRQLVEESFAWHQRLDIVVVNAGRGMPGGVLSSDMEKWRAMVELNVLGAAELMRLAGAKMVQQKSGDVVVLGSVSGHNISPFSGMYGSTKWAITAAAEAMRREVCGAGVRVTTIMPGIVVSEFQAVAGYTAENFGKGVAKFGQLLEPVDIARAIAFVVAQPQHVHINELVIRPTGQDYP